MKTSVKKHDDDEQARTSIVGQHYTRNKSTYLLTGIEPSIDRNEDDPWSIHTEEGDERERERFGFSSMTIHILRDDGEVG